MKITIFGATGNVGSRILAEALFRGHQVTAVVQDSNNFHKLPANANARAGDVGNVDDVVNLSTGQDVVITATRPSPGYEKELVTTTKSLLAGLARTGVRLLVSGGAGSLTVPSAGNTLVVNDPHLVQSAWRDIALACVDQYEDCRNEDVVDWAYLSPPAVLIPGERTGKYRMGTDELLVDAEGTSMISMEDLAVALLDEAEQPKHHRARFTVAY